MSVRGLLQQHRVLGVVLLEAVLEDTILFTQRLNVQLERRLALLEDARLLSKLRHLALLEDARLLSKLRSQRRAQLIYVGLQAHE